MRTIRVPADIKIQNVITKEMTEDTLTFRGIAYDLWLNDPRCAVTPSEVARFCRVVAKFDVAKPGDTIVLDDEDYARLKTVVEAPTKMKHPLISIQIIPFFEAFLGAEES